MIRQVSEDPLIYENEKGEKLTAEKVVCPEHGNEVWYVRDGADIFFVKGDGAELFCEAWRKAVEGN